MKLCWSSLLPSLLVLPSRILLGSVSALEMTSIIRGRGGLGRRGLGGETDDDLIRDAASFVRAFENASDDPNSPTTIQVAVDATINLDEAVGLDPRGIDLAGRYFNAICVGYDETNKCTVERTNSVGRFFRTDWEECCEAACRLPVVFSFKGFEFIGGRAPSVQAGGAFNLEMVSDQAPSLVEFRDCDFVDNTASPVGGAIFYFSKSDSALKFFDCTFMSNRVTMSDCFGCNGGGAIYVDARFAAQDGDTELVVHRTTFRYNVVPDGLENTDIGGDGAFHLNCTDTLLSGTAGDISVPNFEGAEQTCFNGESRTHSPTFSPSPTNSPTSSPTNHPTSLSTGSPTALPTNSPTSSPSRSPTASPTNSPTSSPSAMPTKMPAAPGRTWEDITHDDFDSDLGSFTTIGGSGGTNDATVVDGAVCLSGKGVESSIFHSAQHDVASYSSLYVEVTFVFEGAQSTERLIVEYSADGGANWTVMKRFNFGSFQNGVTYNKLVDFASLSDQAMIRIRSRIIGDGKVCIDEIKFEGLPGN